MKLETLLIFAHAEKATKENICVFLYTAFSMPGWRNW